jgi:uncharacterized membrane protein
VSALLIVSVWVHLLAAIVWIGGMSTLFLVVVPITRRKELGQNGAAFLSPIALRFRAIAWGALLVLVLTGTLNTALRGINPADLLSATYLQASYGRTFMLKLALVAVSLVLSYVHDFRLGPRVSALQQAGASEAEVQRHRKRLLLLARLNALVVVVVLLLAVALPRGGLPLF